MSGADQAHDDHAAPGQGAIAASGHEGHHGDAHGDEHGHPGAESLGPIDWLAWGAAVVGVAAALLVVVVFYVTIRPA
jgi:hypothetical protein